MNLLTKILFISLLSSAAGGTAAASVEGLDIETLSPETTTVLGATRITEVGRRIIGAARRHEIETRIAERIREAALEEAARQEAAAWQTAARAAWQTAWERGAVGGQMIEIDGGLNVVRGAVGGEVFEVEEGMVVARGPIQTIEIEEKRETIIKIVNDFYKKTAYTIISGVTSVAAVGLGGTLGVIMFVGTKKSLDAVANVVLKATKPKREAAIETRLKTEFEKIIKEKKAGTKKVLARGKSAEERMTYFLLSKPKSSGIQAE